MFQDAMDFLGLTGVLRRGLTRPLMLFAITGGTALLISGCGQPPKLPKISKSEQQQEQPAGSTQPATKPAPQSDDKPAAEAPEPKDGRVEIGEKQAGTGKDDDDRSRGLANKKAKPPEPVTAEVPPPPPAPPAATPAPPAPAAQPSKPADGTVATGGAGAPGAGEAEKTYDVMPVFYGTDRAVEPDPQRLAFGADRGKKLQLGRALVTVPFSHKVPAVERPWVVEIPYFKVKIYEEKEDNSKHFTLQEISALSKEQMLAFIKERLAKSKNFKDHAFVFVHGFNTSFDNALYRTAQIAYDMKFDGAPFVYSWPSGGKIASYTYDRGSAEQAEPHLTEFLEMVIKESGAKSISLIAHSMGNELLLRVLERMRPSAPKGVVISQVILAAPDVDRDKFDNIAREITNFSKGVTLYAASNDKALGYSARFWGGVPRAGDVPKTGPLIVPGVDTIDVTAVSTDSLGLNHSGYAESNALLNDIALLLQTGERPPDKRIPILEKVNTPAGDYWRYPQAR
jgi:esterase/lipase superfamily enzyme